MSNAIVGYTIVAYPESISGDWVDELSKLPYGFCWALHDKDVDAEGKTKKEHYHIFILGNPDKKQVRFIKQTLNVELDGQKVRSISGIYDYLTHENSPDKAHYSRDSIHYSPTWDNNVFEGLYTPKRNIEQEMYCNIDEHQLRNYGEVVRWYRVNQPSDLKYVTRRCYAIREYCYQTFMLSEVKGQA